MLVLEVADDLAQAKDTHAESNEIYAVGQLREPEGEALRTRLHIGACKAEDQAKEYHDEGFQ